MNSISKFWTLGQLSLKKEFIYRIDFLFSIFVVPTILVVNYFVWKAVFSLNEIVAGFTFDQMMAYLVFGQLISIFIFNSTSGEIQRKVQSGDFAQDLLKPIHMFYFLLAGATSARFLAFFLEVVPLTVIAWLLFKFTIPQGIVLGLFIVSLVLAFMLNFIIAFIVGLIAFWTVKVEAFQWLTWIVLRVFSVEFFPLSLLPLPAQTVSHFLPFEYLRYRIAMIAVNNSVQEGLWTVAGQLAWIVILSTVSIWLWRVVIKKFTTAGG